MSVLAGTSGWQYRDWRGSFYPPRVPQRRWLEYYATQFATVENNGTFYRLPAREAFASWRDRVTADFVMTVKASRYLTHVRRLRDPAGPVHRLVEAALAVFAHEVRTPLTGILAISDLLATSDLPERERRWADTIKAGAEHLASLATLFVDAAKDRNAATAIREDLFDLRAVARSAGDSLAGRAAAKGLQSRIELSEALPSLVVGDPVRLRAALENLIDNAVKFTEAGIVALDVAPARPTKRSGKGKVAVAFAVSDSGIGLTLTEIKRLFRPFSQANVTIASRFGGAGLGLSSVKQIARTMGGDIVVTPRRGGGTDNGGSDG